MRQDDSAIRSSQAREGQARSGQTSRARTSGVDASSGSEPGPTPRHDWSRAEVAALFDRPFLDLVHAARGVHVAWHDGGAVQCCALLSIKTGACPEDCSYCPQSAHFDTGLERETLMDVDTVLAEAARAKQAGATRFCMGAAWRGAPRGEAFDRVLEMVRGVRGLGMEACVTLGMLDKEQAEALAEAGLTAYNHNLDTSPEYYDRIITTRTYEDRLRTLEHVAEAGLAMCCGGIVGLGESREDRVGLLQALATLTPHPESVPINQLVPVAGTPLAEQAPPDPLELVRTIAVARLLMPKSRVRLSAGRTALSREAQTLAFMAGANSIFFGDTLLTTPNPAEHDDHRLLEDLGLRPA